MSDDRPPIEQVLDVVVYAPIGVAMEVQRRLPEFVRDGRRQAEQRIVLARFLGKMAVHIGKQELTKRIDAMRRPVATPAAGEGGEPTDAPADGGSRPYVVEAGVVEAGVVETGVLDGDVVEVDDLPIPGYDSLSASQVVGRLAALTEDELAAVASYEATHRRRRTILAKVVQIRTREG